MARPLLEASGNAALRGGPAFAVPGGLFLFCGVAAALAVISMILFACGSKDEKKKSDKAGSATCCSGGGGCGDGCGGCGGGCGGCGGCGG